jgi:hypothetical protein
MKRLLGFSFAVLLTFALPGVARAQGVLVWHVNYFDNVNVSGAPDSKVRIVNSGAEAPLTLLGGDLCAMTYVFAPDQQLEECCGCLVTPDALLKLSVSKDLTYSPLHAGTLTAGTIKIVESLPNVPPGTPRPGSSPKCDPAATPIPLANSTLAALAVWGTHNQQTASGAFQFTETGDHHVLSVFASKTNTEPLVLAALCLIDVQVNGSGRGRCHCPGETPVAW